MHFAVDLPWVHKLVQGAAAVTKSCLPFTNKAMQGNLRRLGPQDVSGRSYFSSCLQVRQQSWAENYSSMLTQGKVHVHQDVLSIPGEVPTIMES